MKKEEVLILSLVFLIIFSSFASAALVTCSLNVTLVNQDPYPAVPGDYVDLLFKIQGLERSDCTEVYFDIIPQYPIILDPDQKTELRVTGGTFVQGKASYLLAPYKVRIDENALEGDNPIKVKYSSGDPTKAYDSKEFNIRVENVKADFEVHIKDYDPVTKILTLEILNVGENNIEALTIEVPTQENIKIKGSNINIVGDLDSNEFTTADFEATPSNGEISLVVRYTDTTGVRRQTTEAVSFDPVYFEDRANGQTGTSTSTYVILVLVILIIAYWLYARYKRKKKDHKLRPFSH